MAFVKVRVLIGLALFLHLLAHPLLHAADGHLALPSSSSSFVNLDSAPSAPECAICHVAGVLDVSAPVAAVHADLDATPAVLLPQEFAKSDGVDRLQTSRGPPCVVPA